MGVPFVLVVMMGCPPTPGPQATDSSTTDVGVTDSGTTDFGTTDSGTTDSGAAVCGNGIVEADEPCDDGEETATCDVDCSTVECGDRHVNAAAGEACDLTELGGETCRTQGFESGALACDACALDTSNCSDLPAAPVLELSFSPVKQFDFAWAEAAGAEHYQLLESATPGEPFVQLGEDIVGESISLTMPLHLRSEASYVLRACNAVGCSESAPVSVMGSLAEAIGLFKASNRTSWFGESVALSDDGNTLAVGSSGESSSATGIDGDQTDDSASASGAVYVYVRDGAGRWSQQAYVKASNTGRRDRFGVSVALSDDGDTLAVGAMEEDGSATGIDGDQADDSTPDAGAVYVLVRDPMGQWSQQAYVKASNTDEGDLFGWSISLGGDGNTLAVGAPFEDGSATGIDGDQGDETVHDAGAVYVFVRDPMGQWSQQAYAKASNTDEGDFFGSSVALNGDGNTLAVGAHGEASSATGIDGDQADDSADWAGAAYVLVRDPMGQWSQQAYVKASNTDDDDLFGWSISLSADGDTLAIGAWWERSSAAGIDGDQADDSARWAGAAYVLVRDPMGQWSQQAYVKASNTDPYDFFGESVALSGDGNMLAVGAHGEDSTATGIGGDQADNFELDTGAAYVFVRDPMGEWSQQAYVKASSVHSSLWTAFGEHVALSGDGNTLAVGDPEETHWQAISTGAVYLY